MFYDIFLKHVFAFSFLCCGHSQLNQVITGVHEQNGYKMRATLKLVNSLSVSFKMLQLELFAIENSVSLEREPIA